MKLSDNEEIIKKGSANLQRGIETVGGKLYLTNERLNFESHKLNIQTGNLEISLKEINSLKKSWTKLFGVIPLFPNAIKVLTKSNNEYIFTLLGRDAWISEIRNISSF